MTLTISGYQITEQIYESANSLVFRAISKENVWNPTSGVLKIIDFGISTRLSRQHLSLKNPDGLEGTLAYMSPEQTGRMNRALDYHTDFYSLGVTFYELLTGRLPFEIDDPLALVHAHLAKIPVPVADMNPDIPLILSDIVMKLLAKNAEERYQSAFGVKADLERCLAAMKGRRGLHGLEDLCFTLGRDDHSGQLARRETARAVPFRRRGTA